MSFVKCKSVHDLHIIEWHKVHSRISYALTPNVLHDAMNHLRITQICNLDCDSLQTSRVIRRVRRQRIRVARDGGGSILLQ